MDCKLYALLVAVFAAVCLSCCSAMSIPKDKAVDGVDPNERATWLDTRENNVNSDEENFKNLVLYSLVQLEDEGFINPGTVQKGNSVEKRGRWQGFCFRRTRSGRFLPYICWKGEGEAESRK